MHADIRLEETRPGHDVCH